MYYENTDLFSFYLHILFICDNCCMYPKPLSYFICLLMPIEQIVEFKKKEKHSNLKAKVYFFALACVFVLYTSMCLYQNIFVAGFNVILVI